MSKLIRWVSYFAIIVAPFLMINFLGESFSLLRESIKILLILIILYVCLGGRNIFAPFLRRRLQSLYPLGFILFWAVYAVISLMWTPDRSNGINHIYFLGVGTFFALLFSIFFDKKEHFMMAFRCLLIMVIVQSLIGWYEVLFRHYFYLSDAVKIAIYSSPEKRFPVAMAGNTNNYAVLMLFGIFVGYICYQCRRAKWEGIVSLLTAFSCCIHLLMTESRACLLGLMMAVGMFAILLFKPKPRLLAALAGIAVVSALLLPGVRENLLSLLDFDFRPGHLNSVAERLNLIRNGFYFLAQTWGFGTGAGGIEQSMLSAPYPTDGIINMHNWWMEILTEFGILVFIGYLIFYGKLFADFYRCARRTHEPAIKAICMGLLCCMTGFLIASISPSSVMSIEWLWVFWALAVAFHGYITSPADKPVDESPLIKKPAWIA